MVVLAVIQAYLLFDWRLQNIGMGFIIRKSRVDFGHDNYSLEIAPYYDWIRWYITYSELFTDSKSDN